MFAAEVIGTVVATRKHQKLAGRKLLIVRGLGRDDEVTQDEMVAVDTVGAGVGDRVLVLREGGSASMAMDTPRAPVNVVIVGIIDEIGLGADPVDNCPQDAQNHADRLSLDV